MFFRPLAMPQVANVFLFVATLCVPTFLCDKLCIMCLDQLYIAVTATSYRQLLVC